MKNITLEELLEAGCHFGHQVTRQNPKARDYIFEARDNIHIIDLEKTKECLEEAAAYIKQLAKSGGTMMVLGTKRQAQEVLKEQMNKMSIEDKSGLYWTTKRWIGGTFTNLPEVSKNYKKLLDIEKRLKDEFAKAEYTKREIGEWEKEKQKLQGYYGGVVTMSKVPDAIFVIDTHLEDLAVREAMAMKVKTVGITDTNSDPTVIDFPIPANDDAVGSVNLIVGYILEAWKEGKKNMEVATLDVEKKEVKKTDVEKEEKVVKTKSVNTGKNVKTEKKDSSKKVEKKRTDEKKETK